MKISISRSIVKGALAASTLLVPALAFVAPANAQAQATEHVNVRGSIVSTKGSVLKVRTREGKTVDVMLAPDAKVAGVAKASTSDIKSGDYVGIASLPKEDGGDGALEVLIFPPAMKGLGEGSHGWDLKPKSSMTNATVANAVKGIDGHTVTVNYQGKEKKIAIPDGTPVVTLAPAAAKDLVAGAIVFISAEKDAKGSMVTHQVVVGANGVVPPM
jgi:hypothetical protein